MAKVPVYLDYQATTPCDARVMDKMLPYFTGTYGNPSSIDHMIGNAAKQAVERERERILRLLGDPRGKLIFTSGATESNNLALLGYARANRNRGQHIIACTTEHRAVLDPLKHLAKHEGFEVTLIPVDSSGIVCLDKLKASLRPDTLVVSIMAANNEVGTIAPIRSIAEMVHEHSSAIFHCDATQAIGMISIDVNDLGIDAMSFSGHKIYGPKGIGALYIRRGLPLRRFVPIQYGGGHEKGLRSGTLNTPGIIGLAEALHLYKKEREFESKRLAHLRDLLTNLILEESREAELNGHPANRLPQNANLYIRGVNSKSLMHLLRDDVCISSGSACTSEEVLPSHVIMALGHSPERAHSSIRISFGRFTTEEEVRFAASRINAAVARIRKVGGT